MTPDEIKALLEEQKQLIASLQTENDRKIKGLITEAAFSDKMAATQKVLDEVNKELARLKSPVTQADDKGGNKQAIFHKAAFETFLRKGGHALTPEERKVMTVADSTTGGYLAPVEFVSEMIKFIVEYSPLRTVARVTTTNAPAKRWPKKTQSASAAWIDETGTRAETTNPKFGLETIPVHEMYALAIVSKHDLEDAQFNLQGFLLEEFAEQFGVTEGTAFILGNAVGRPQGILTNAEVGGYTATVAAAGKIGADDMKHLFFSLKEAYAKSAVWLWRRTSTLAISLLKDSVSGAYLWQPGLQLGEPPNVLGRPYIECPDMPAEASATKAIAFGDFRRGYIIVDRIQVEVMEDPYSSKSTGCMEFSARKRVGGQVVLPEAIKILTLKT